jgi:hypothetical protein
MSENEDPNKLFKALAKLKGIRANIDPKRHDIHEKYVHEYNATVDEIASSINDDLGTFLVPDSEIKPRITGGNYMTGETKYSSDNWSEVQLLLTKLDSLINYLETLLGNQQPKQPFGFTDKT